MRVKSILAAQLLDGFAAVGLDREAIRIAAGIDREALGDPRGYLEWSTLAGLLETGWQTLGEDEEQMRRAGGALVRAPSYVFVRRLARSVVSVERIYDIGTRWGAPAKLPHLTLRQHVLPGRRRRFVATIPEPHAGSVALGHIFTGFLLEIPSVMGLPRATLLSHEVTARRFDVSIRLPPSPAVATRLGRAVRARLRFVESVNFLEEQRRELTEALREAQRSTAENWDVLDRLPDFVLIHRDGVLLWMNRANVRALGYERREELVGRPVLDFAEPSSHGEIRTRMGRALGADVSTSEVNLRARDGSLLVIEAAPALPVTFDGRIARMVVGRDVTERIRMQERLLVADRMASIGMLAAGVAHEVNNPLGYVLNNIEIALRGLASHGDGVSQSREALGVALEGVDRIRTIVRDLLALSRVDDATIGPIDVVAVVESTLTLARKEIVERASLDFEHEPVVPTVGTVARLGQVVLNLVTNALEAMSGLPRERRVLRVTVRPSAAGGAEVEVADNGTGILPEHAGHVFEPFFTTKAAGQGTGLGLAISRRLVAEMGGELSFESTPGQGSTFRVRLPSWEETPDRTPPPSSRRAGHPVAPHNLAKVD